MKINCCNCARDGIPNIFLTILFDQVLKVGDIILGKVAGKRPFGVFVRILSLVHGRNLDFNDIDIQVNTNISLKHSTVAIDPRFRHFVPGDFIV
jgi:exosome complex RNA-binding protein Csl4